MNSSNLVLLRKSRSLCLLYGVISLTVGLVNFAVLNEYGLGMIMVTIAIFGFWRISHKIKGVLLSENVK
ncbi:MAG: hypothetical protein JNN05_03265 [Candidatus Omnitrophica bacterium]|nr:hypothetical protein [Candidatus Omnitrophota bacterium]